MKNTTTCDDLWSPVPPLMVVPSWLWLPHRRSEEDLLGNLRKKTVLTSYPKREREVVVKTNLFSDIVILGSHSHIIRDSELIDCLTV